MAPADRTERAGPGSVSAEDSQPVLIGAATFTIAFLLTGTVGIATTGFEFIEVTRTDGLSASVPSGNVIAWVFYQAHGVAVSVSPSDWSFGGTLIASPVVYLVPPLVLGFGGYLSAKLNGDQEFWTAVRNGAAIAPGYLLFALGGIALAAYSVSSSWAEFSVRVDLLPGIVLAGIVYPLVFGVAGAAVAYVMGRTTAGEGTRTRREQALAVVAVVGLVFLVAIAMLV